ncbi:MAG TPA: hypothetical protein VJQ80_12740 [Arthrobacter sp.]|nr:hypothetical protein [Arthrobacter sp.]
MHKKTLLSGLLAAPILMGFVAGPSFAGEVTGPPGADGFATGKSTPISNYTANSICAFSGLNAYHPGKEGEYLGHVQNYGALVIQGMKDKIPSPGEACNGHTGELAGGN